MRRKSSAEECRLARLGAELVMVAGEKLLAGSMTTGRRLSDKGYGQYHLKWKSLSHNVYQKLLCPPLYALPKEDRVTSAGPNTTVPGQTII